MTQATYRRCQDPAVIEDILARDGFDEPFPSFSRSFLRHTSRVLLAASPGVYFITVDWDGRYAGFTFAQTLGPDMWRRFAREQVLSHPLAIGQILWRTKVRPFLRRSGRGNPDRLRQSRDSATAGDLGFEAARIDRPFSWSRDRAGAGQIDVLFVSSKYRGLGLATGLLLFAVEEMSKGGVSLVEAHVDSGNLASVRAFLKAGFHAFRTTGGDFYVSYQVPDLQPKGP